MTYMYNCSGSNSRNCSTRGCTLVVLVFIDVRCSGTLSISMRC